MTSEMHTVAIDDTVDECMRVMTHHQSATCRFSTTAGLAGVVRSGDLVKRSSPTGAHHQPLHTYIGANYPA